MKKFLLGVVAVLSMAVFAGCGDIFIDKVGVHNGLIQKMDGVLDSEKGFYDAYIVMVEGSDTSAVASAYDKFVLAAGDLDTYVKETKFAASQQVFIDEYDSYYKPFIDEYVKSAGEFVAAVQKDGAKQAVMQPFFAKLDQYTVDYVEAHNKFVGTVNMQSDYKAGGENY